MQTGLVDSWTSDPNLWGPVYPFVGAEFFFFIVAVVVWLGWTVWQIRHENAIYDYESTSLRKGDNLQKAVGEYHAATRSFFGD